jgi:phage terminase large subunit-like protein
MTKQEAVHFLLYRPVDFAHLLGFDKLTDLHNDWIINMVRGTEDDTLRAHRGSYKTTCVSFALSLIIILLPNCRTMFMRKTDADVKEVIRQVQNILKDPHTVYLVQCIYGIQLKLTVESATEVSTNLTTDIKGTSQLVGYGTGASLTGKHFDRIFTDDIINVKDRISKAERDHTKLIYQELQNIKNRGGRIFNTGTPWHKNDCFEIMPKATDYDCYSTGLISEEELAHIKASMVPSLFAANYEMRHIASDDVIFTDPKTGADPEMIRDAISHIDAAYGGEDWTAFTAMNKIDGKYYILGKCWHKHVDDVKGDIVSTIDQYMLGKTYCEDNGDKGYLAKDLRQCGLRVVKYHESMNKFLKISTYLKAIWKDVIFVEGTDPGYIEQICDYTEDAEHDDCPDSAACLARLLYKKKSNDDYKPRIYA